MTGMQERVHIDAGGVHYTPLNRQIREAIAGGAGEIVLENVLGQRFIADGLRGDVTITIHGVPGGDLGMFMSGPTCIVHGNCDHAPGNTMDAGRIIIHGSAGDAVAHSMRGGRVFVRDDIGYRGAIHMKQYEEKRPALVVGGCPRAFFGEYMAGGLALVLNLGRKEPCMGRGIGSGIHGGEIYIRGDVDERLLGVGAMIKPFGEEQRNALTPLIDEFASHFGLDAASLLDAEYTRIGPASARPFAGKYTWE
jgi:glutamate synthase domain-containing protein 3